MSVTLSSPLRSPFRKRGVGVSWKRKPEMVEEWVTVSSPHRMLEHQEMWATMYSPHRELEHQRDVGDHVGLTENWNTNEWETMWPSPGTGTRTGVSDHAALTGNRNTNERERPCGPHRELEHERAWATMRPSPGTQTWIGVSVHATQEQEQEREWAIMRPSPRTRTRTDVSDHAALTGNSNTWRQWRLSKLVLMTTLRGAKIDDVEDKAMKIMMFWKRLWK